MSLSNTLVILTAWAIIIYFIDKFVPDKGFGIIVRNISIISTIFSAQLVTKNWTLTLIFATVFFSVLVWEKLAPRNPYHFSSSENIRNAKMLLYKNSGRILAFAIAHQLLMIYIQNGVSMRMELQFGYRLLSGLYF